MLSMISPIYYIKKELFLCTKFIINIIYTLVIFTFMFHYIYIFNKLHVVYSI